MTELIERDKVIDKLKQAYWDRDMQQAKDDPCVIDAMIDWSIRQVKDVPTYNSWHTGTPTEIEEDKYWKWNYVLVLHTEYDCIGDYLAGMLFAPDFERQVFTAPQGGGKELIVPFEDVVAWQKIGPFVKEMVYDI